MADEQLSEEQDETRLCLFASCLLVAYLGFSVYRLNAEVTVERKHRIDQCAFVALHKLGAIGKLDDESETCTVRMRFRSNLGPEPAFYEQDVPVDELPPPSI